MIGATTDPSLSDLSSSTNTSVPASLQSVNTCNTTVVSRGKSTCTILLKSHSISEPQPYYEPPDDEPISSGFSSSKFRSCSIRDGSSSRRMRHHHIHSSRIGSHKLPRPPSLLAVLKKSIHYAQSDQMPRTDFGLETYASSSDTDSCSSEKPFLQPSCALQSKGNLTNL